MSDPKESENVTNIEETSADQADQTPDQSSEQAPAKKSKHPFISLLLLLIAAGIIIALFAPQQLKDKYLSPLTQWVSSMQKEVSITETAPVVQPHQFDQPDQPDQPTVSQEKAPTQEIASEIANKLSNTPAFNPASSEEITQVLDAMNALQGELQTLRDRQQVLKQTQHSVQLMQLRTRLRWITNPANHLPQLQLAWEEISLMPLLSASDRKQAQSMLKLAEDRLQQVQKWQQILQGHAASLATPEHDNIIPEFKYQWLNWIAKQFSIRPSLSREEAENARLREKLINISRNIEIEQWPDTTTWVQLRARLQLTMLSGEKSGDKPVGIDLPESFEMVKFDISLLRQTALRWLERLQ